MLTYLFALLVSMGGWRTGVGYYSKRRLVWQVRLGRLFVAVVALSLSAAYGILFTNDQGVVSRWLKFEKMTMMAFFRFCQVVVFALAHFDVRRTVEHAISLRCTFCCFCCASITNEGCARDVDVGRRSLQRVILHYKSQPKLHFILLTY